MGPRLGLFPPKKSKRARYVSTNKHTQCYAAQRELGSATATRLVQSILGLPDFLFGNIIYYRTLQRYLRLYTMLTCLLVQSSNLTVQRRGEYRLQST
jgi:hypothetical protein